MTEEERKAKDAARKREAYARRKKREEQARQPLNDPETVARLDAELEREFQMEKASAQIHPIYPPGVLYQDKPSHPLADEPALLADSILNSYARDFSNANALLRHILAHLIRIEIALGDRK